MLFLLACKHEPEPDPRPTQTGWTCEAPTERVVFTEVSASWGLEDTTDNWEEVGEIGVGSGPVFGDWDRDGDDDLLLGVRTKGFYFHWNEGDHFRVEKLDWGQVGLTSATLDMDGDGVLDLLLAGADSARGPNNVQVFTGDGAGNFEATPDLLVQAMPVYGFAGSDYDGDDRLDLYATLSGSDLLFHGTGGGEFEEVGASLGLAALSERSWMGLFLDANGDGQEDIVVTNDLQENGVNTTLLINEGDSFAATEFDPAPVNSMGASVGDINGDGKVDVYIAGTAYNELYSNDGSGRFIEVGRANGAMGDYCQLCMSLGTLPVDFDIDGDMDIIAIEGRVGLPELVATQDPIEPDQLLVNDGGSFSNQADALGFGSDEDGRTVSMGFLTEDGTPDFVVGQIGYASKLYQSSCTGKGSVLFELVGTGDNANGLGAKVTLVTSAGNQTDWVSISSGLNGQKYPGVFFGYGEATLERVEIAWPTGETQSVELEADFSGRMRISKE